MIKLDSTCPFPLRRLEEVVEVLDRYRKPINATERANRTGPYPYYGANGQVGTIDEFLFDEELVLVAEDGGFFFDPDKPISYRVSGKCWVNNHAHVLRPLGCIDVDWLNFSIAFQDITHFVKGSTRTKLNQEEMRQITVPLPPIQEQRRIVARIKEMMERVDEIRGLRNEAGREASAVFASVLAENFKPLQDKANLKTIGSVTLESRYGTNHKCNGDISGSPILRIPNVAEGVVNTADLKFCELSDREKELLFLKDGDLLVVRTNGSPNLVGRCAVYRKMDREHAFASYLIRFRLDQSKVEPQFAAFFLESTSGRDAIASIRKTSAGQFNVNSENLQAIKLPCPPLEVQRKMVDQMFAQRQIVNQIREGLSAKDKEAAGLQQSILRKAFAGKL